MITARTAFTILISKLSRKPTNKESPFSAKSGAVLRGGAGSAGKQALNPETHRIFSIFYAPALLKPERRETPVSQIDVLPTLLGLLKWPYDAAFYGKDALKPSYQSRYFVSNYQYIGYLKGKDMVVLKPQRRVEFFRDGKAVEPDGRMKELEKEAVYYYQHASDWRTNLKE